jgi:hypothetical protein
MRVCILCENSKLEEVRKEKRNDSILKTPVSPNGEEPSTHMFCCMAMSEERAKEMVLGAKLTTMEISGPKEFLEKWNLKIIKK